MNYFLELTSVNKTYDSKKILVDLDLKIKEETITIIMGPNGAGKTTLLHTILGFTKLDSGKLLMQGIELSSDLTMEQKSKICYIPDSPTFLEYLTGIENLRYISKLYKKNIPLNNLEKIMNDYGLESSNNSMVINYSRGMRAKLNLCFTEIIDASLIIFDEPTIGLDIVSIDFLKSKILYFKSLGKTILITSHDMDFVRSIADEIYLLNNKKTSILFDSTEKSKIRDIHFLTDSLLVALGK